MLRKLLGFTAMAALVTVTGCSETTGADVGLTADEAALLADDFVALALDGVASGLSAIPSPAPGLASSSAQAAAPPIQFDRSTTITRECPAGGSMTMEGTVSGALDDARSGTLAVQHTLTISDCGRQREEITITANTDPSIVFSGEVVVEGRTRVSGSFTKIGAITVETSDGRSGRCEIDLAVTWTAEDHWTATGTVCGREVTRERDRVA